MTFVGSNASQSHPRTVTLDTSHQKPRTITRTVRVCPDRTGDASHPLPRVSEAPACRNGFATSVPARTSHRPAKNSSAVDVDAASARRVCDQFAATPASAAGRVCQSQLTSIPESSPAATMSWLSSEEARGAAGLARHWIDASSELRFAPYQPNTQSPVMPFADLASGSLKRRRDERQDGLSELAQHKEQRSSCKMNGKSNGGYVASAGAAQQARLHGAVFLDSTQKSAFPELLPAAAAEADVAFPSGPSGVVSPVWESNSGLLAGSLLGGSLTGALADSPVLYEERFADPLWNHGLTYSVYPADYNADGGLFATAAAAGAGDDAGEDYNADAVDVPRIDSSAHINDLIAQYSRADVVAAADAAEATAAATLVFPSDDVSASRGFPFSFRQPRFDGPSNSAGAGGAAVWLEKCAARSDKFSPSGPRLDSGFRDWTVAAPYDRFNRLPRVAEEVEEPRESGLQESDTWEVLRAGKRLRTGKEAQRADSRAVDASRAEVETPQVKETKRDAERIVAEEKENDPAGATTGAADAETSLVSGSLAAGLLAGWAHATAVAELPAAADAVAEVPAVALDGSATPYHTPHMTPYHTPERQIGADVAGLQAAQGLADACAPGTGSPADVAAPGTGIAELCSLEDTWQVSSSTKRAMKEWLETVGGTGEAGKGEGEEEDGGNAGEGEDGTGPLDWLLKASPPRIHEGDLPSEGVLPQGGVSTHWGVLPSWVLEELEGAGEEEGVEKKDDLKDYMEEAFSEDEGLQVLVRADSHESSTAGPSVYSPWSRVVESGVRAAEEGETQVKKQQQQEEEEGWKGKKGGQLQDVPSAWMNGCDSIDLGLEYAAVEESEGGGEEGEEEADVATGEASGKDSVSHAWREEEEEDEGHEDEEEEGVGESAAVGSSDADDGADCDSDVDADAAGDGHGGEDGSGCEPEGFSFDDSSFVREIEAQLLA